MQEPRFAHRSARPPPGQDPGQRAQRAPRPPAPVPFPRPGTPHRARVRRPGSAWAPWRTGRAGWPSSGRPAVSACASCPGSGATGAPWGARSVRRGAAGRVAGRVRRWPACAAAARVAVRRRDVRGRRSRWSSGSGVRGRRAAWRLGSGSALARLSGSAWGRGSRTAPRRLGRRPRSRGSARRHRTSPRPSPPAGCTTPLPNRCTSSRPAPSSASTTSSACCPGETCRRCRS